MIYDFLEFIKRMGVFLLCAECILHFAPGNSYQKYIRALIGLMILMQFMVPIRAILTGEEKAVIESQVNELRYQLESISESAKTDITEDIPDQNELIFANINEEIKLRLNSIPNPENLSYLVTDVKIGNISRVFVKTGTEEGGGQDNHIKIPIISIGSVTLGEEENQSEIPELRKLFANELNIEEEYLEVVIID